MGKKDKKPAKLPTPSDSESEEQPEEENPDLSSSDISELSEQEEVKKPAAKKAQGGGGKPEDIQVFVSGIPYECSEEEFKGFFGDLIKDIKEVKLPRYQDSGRCIGYAHITMKSQEAAQKALELTGQKLKGRYLDLKEAEGKNNAQFSKDETRQIADSMPEDCQTIFVKNLPYTFKEDEVGDRFRRFGAIKSIRLAYNWMTKQSKGFAYIRFDNHTSAKRALVEMNGKEVQGRRIKVDFDVVQEAKKGYKINLSNQDKGNKLYNKDVIKDELNKRKLKAKDKQKTAMARMTTATVDK